MAFQSIADIAAQTAARAAAVKAITTIPGVSPEERVAVLATAPVMAWDPITQLMQEAPAPGPMTQRTADILTAAGVTNLPPIVNGGKQMVYTNGVATLAGATTLQAGDELNVLQAGLGLEDLWKAITGGIAGFALGGVGGAILGAAGAVIGGEVMEGIAGNGAVVNGVPISGPGVQEPPAAMVAKAWNVAVHSNTYGTFRMYYWKLHDGRIMSYNGTVKEWKIWRPKKHIVISSNPRVKTLGKLAKLNKRVEKMLKPYQPKQRAFPAKALARTYLSTAERKLLGAGK